MEKRNSQLQCTYRQVAKGMASGLPLEGEKFREAIVEYLRAIKSLPIADRIALKCAWIFSRRVPAQERQDCLQHFYLLLLDKPTQDERLAYTIARCDWKNWWRDYTRYAQYVTRYLSENVGIDGEGEIELAEALAGDVDFERRLIGDMDGQALYDKLPAWVQRLVNRAIIGYPIKGGERQLLNKWIAQRPTIITRPDYATVY